MGVNPIPVNRAQGPEFWPNSGNSGFPNLSHSVPNGRVIKYPPKCALFPGRPRGAPGDPEIGGPGRPRNGPRKVGQRRVPWGPWDMDPAGGLQNPRGIPTWIDTHPQDPRGYKLSSSRTPYSAYQSRRWVSVVSRDLEFELRVMGGRYVVGESALGYGSEPWRLLPQSAISLGAGSQR